MGWFGVQEDTFVSFVETKLNLSINKKYYSHKYFSPKDKSSNSNLKISDHLKIDYYIISTGLVSNNKNWIVYNDEYEDSLMLRELVKEKQDTHSSERIKEKQILELPGTPEDYINGLKAETNTDNGGEIIMSDEKSKFMASMEAMATAKGKTLQELLELIQNQEDLADYESLGVIGKKHNADVSLEDFEKAENYLENCSDYEPQNAYDNATYLLFKETDEQSVAKLEEYKKYLTYNMETKRKNRLNENKQCKPFRKWVYEKADETTDMVGESVFFKSLLATLKGLKEQYVKDDMHRSGEVSFSFVVNRAIKQLEDREGKEQFWKPKTERATGKKKITKKMMDDFLFVANGKTIMLPEGNRVFKIRGENFGEDGEQVRAFILQHGKKDNFKDAVSNLIHNY